MVTAPPPMRVSVNAEATFVGRLTTVLKATLRLVTLDRCAEPPLTDVPETRGAGGAAALPFSSRPTRLEEWATTRSGLPSALKSPTARYWPPPLPVWVSY